MGTKGLWGLLLLLLLHDAASQQCPCMVDHAGVLTCQPHTIAQFPEDLNTEDCNIHTGSVRDITLSRQSFTEIKDLAFSAFPHLEIINFAYNEIEVVRSKAFADVPEVREINLKRNNLKTIENGAFDDVVKLSNLDVRDNPLLERYETAAWHFCERTKYGMSIEGDLDIFKNLDYSPTTQDYCNYMQNSMAVPYCHLDKKGHVLDCTGQKNLPEVVCHIQDLHFSTIMFDFPEDYDPPFVENYFEGESNGFIMDFNSIKGSENHTKLMETLPLFNSKFDLSSLPSLTSYRTREVILKADTVYITEPITIDYKLTIHARVVSLNSSIQMSMRKEAFLDLEGHTLEPWAFKEETVSVGQVVMRHRKLGLIEIVDHLPDDILPPGPGDFCQSLFINSTERVMDLTAWFDTTFINLNYVCARTIQSSGSNLKLASQIANFTLNFAFNAEDVQNREAYMAAQKFKQIIRLAKDPDIHMVPTYSIGTVSELAGVMVDRMTQYRANEIAQEEQLFIATGRVQDMQVQFDLIQQQQKMYFQMEQSILDAIWAATDNAWNYTFEHRNEMEETIMGAMNASAEAAFEMREQEFKELLAKAEANLEHMEDVRDKFASQLGRLKEMATASMDTVHGISNNLVSKESILESEIASLEKAVADFIHDTIVANTVTGFRCWWYIFWGYPCSNPPAWLANIPRILKDLMDKINDIMDVIGDLDNNGLDQMSDDLSTTFKNALHAATELTKSGPKFDEVKNMAANQMPSFKAACHYSVDVSGIMEAMFNVADTGHALTEATSKFADVVLDLADMKDEIRVATEDLARAIEEVEIIEEMLDELEKHRDDYADYMEEAQKQYEDAVDRMAEEYQDMSTDMKAEFQANITAQFENYQQVFMQTRAKYLTQLSALIASITDKSFGLKKHSINQRSMIMSLYIDFCDAFFYHSFSICDRSDIPLMSDDFELLLEKLSDIKWDSITSTSNLPGIPIQLGPVHVMMEDDPDNYKYPISTLRNQSRMDFNLKDYDVTGNLDRFWRVRLSLLRIILLDENDLPIQSPGDNFGQEIQSLITFPTVFNDTYINHDSYTFLCQEFFCTADYNTNGEEVIFKSSCEVDEEFSDLNYKPSPDGVFSIYLPNSDKIAITDVYKVKVEFSGTYIPYNGKKIEWIY